MTCNLPPNLLRLFAPRPPIKYLPPMDRDFRERHAPAFSGLAAFLPRAAGHDAAYSPTLSADDQRAEKALDKAAAHRALHGRMRADAPAVHASDPYTTLFVSNLPYHLSERHLRREFDSFGAIQSLVMVHDKDAKFKGYAFIEYEKEKDMKTAYKDTNGSRVDGRRIVVDVERGRTVKDWKPRRLGGGLGSKRDGSYRYPERPRSGRDDASRPRSGRDDASRYRHNDGGRRDGGYSRDRPSFGDRVSQGSFGGDRRPGIGSRPDSRGDSYRSRSPRAQRDR